MRQEVRHFRPQEFVCPCCGAGRPAALLVLWLEGLREAWGGPVVVNSGFRCERHNAEVGGARRSRHLVGCAADVRPAEGSMADFARLVRRLGSLPGWELRFYGTFVHVGVPRREAARLWLGEEVEAGREGALAGTGDRV